MKHISQKPKKLSSNDRFIPSRDSDNASGKLNILDEFSINKKEGQNQENNEQVTDSSESRLPYNTLLYNQVLGIKDPFTIHQLNGLNYVFTGYPYTQKFSLFHYQARNTSNILADFGASEQNPGYVSSHLRGFSEENQGILSPSKFNRNISKSPFKVLDAPGLQDDFYLNVVDWSTQGILAVGLGSTIYLWSAAGGQVTKLFDVGPNDSFTSVGWSPKGNYLALGTQKGELQLWDAISSKQLYSIKSNEGRIGTISWNSQILSTGSRDKTIMHRDIRQKGICFSKSEGHKQEVCGLKWSTDGQQLASGGNDNKLMVWSARNFDQPCSKFSSHTAAVKAIGWSPLQHGLLASGGGTADRCIRFWNTLTNTGLDSIDTGSQVCSILFGSNENELVSAHGYSQNQIIVWKYPIMRKLATLTGHTSRVLYLCMSNDGETIVSGAGDETLRFWKVFSQTQQNVQQTSLIVPSGKDIR